MAVLSVSVFELNRFSADRFIAHLGLIYEHSPWIAAKAWEQRPFSSRADLLAKLDGTVRSAAAGQRLALIQAHPDLAGRLAQVGALTAASTQEQQSAGLDGLSSDEASEFDRLNKAYLARFGFPFVICARLNNRQTILQAFHRRLGHTPEEEVAAALAEIYQIARLRLAQIVHD